ncbi:MAG: porin [Xanthomonadaceae bacterium]|nr:porin [Xanthomonadaceae bacterium]
MSQLQHPPERFFLLIACFLGFSGVAFAQEFSLYGVAHLSLDSIESGRDEEFDAASNSSRVGIRGKFDLAPDIAMVFQYEQGLDLTFRGENDGNGPVSRDGPVTTVRDSWLGLDTRFGALKGGKFGGLNQWVYNFNLFADQIGDLGNLWGGTGLPGRVSEGLQFSLPEFRGFNARATWVPDEGRGDQNILVYSANFQYRGLNLGTGFLDLGRDIALDERDHLAWALTASHGIDRFNLGLGWQREIGIDGQRARQRNSFTFGASAEVLPQTRIKSQVTVSDANRSDADAWQWAISTERSLGERVLIYLAFSRTFNESAAAFSTNNYGKGRALFPAAGKDPWAVSLGLNISFERNLARLIGVR